MINSEPFTPEQEQEIFDLLIEKPNSKLYLGCDSIAYKNGRNKDGSPIWFGKFATVLIVHKEGRHGCRIFRYIDHERVYDSKKNRPADRLMKEVYRTAALYRQLSGLIDGFPLEIHLDINPNKEYGSSVVIVQATGYILGVTGIEPKVKPDAFAASFGADGIGRGFDLRATSYGKHVH